MTDEPRREPRYDDWIANRRAVEPSRDLTNQVMATVERQNAQVVRHVRLAEKMNNSLPARCAACVSAMLVGSLPFLYVAYAAKLIAL